MTECSYEPTRTGEGMKVSISILIVFLTMTVFPGPDTTSAQQTGLSTDLSTLEGMSATELRGYVKGLREGSLIGNKQLLSPGAEAPIEIPVPDVPVPVLPIPIPIPAQPCKKPTFCDLVPTAPSCNCEVR